MHLMRLLSAALVPLFATAGVVASASGAAARPSTVKHVITCKFTERPAPSRTHINSNTVTGAVSVQCSDALDDASTTATLQIYENGAYRDYGTGVTSHAKGPHNINVTDGAGLRAGCWTYRVKGEHFGKHGNIWVLPNYYSSHDRICRV